MKMRYNFILRNITSHVLTIIAWFFPLALVSLICKDLPDTDIYIAYRTGNFFTYVMIVSVLLGSVHWLLNKFTDIPAIRRLSLSLILGIRIVAFLFIIALYDFLDIMTIFDENFALVTKKINLQYITTSQFLSTVAFFLFIDTIYGWFYQIRTIFGKTMFRNLLIGKYRTPRAEKRIFMFIDMKDSTAHAEKLGHVKFTRLIQECFRDFGVIAQKRDVDIYQYIGDEVVVSWWIKSGTREQNCLRLFFEFRNKLQKSWPEYQRKYNVKPVFKAGIHSGYVTIAEIGLYKRGIEYLSDVLNTAARIQGMCNQYHADLLISGDVYEYFSEIPYFRMKEIQNVQLKGKQQKVQIYSVEQKVQR